MLEESFELRRDSSNRSRVIESLLYNEFSLLRDLVRPRDQRIM